MSGFVGEGVVICAFTEKVSINGAISFSASPIIKFTKCLHWLFNSCKSKVQPEMISLIWRYVLNGIKMVELREDFIIINLSVFSTFYATNGYTPESSKKCGLIVIINI